MWHLTLLIMGLLLLPEQASAQQRDRPRMSDRGRTLVTGAIGGSWSHDTASRQMQETVWAIDISPSFMYFLWQGIGIGPYASYALEHRRVRTMWPYYNLGPWLSQDVTESRVKLDRMSAGAQTMAELAITARVGLFFWIAAGYCHERARADDSTQFFTSSARGATTQQRLPRGGLPRTSDALELWLFVPLTFHVSESVGLGFGPRLSWRGYFRRDGERGVIDANRTHIGASSWVGTSF